MDIILVLAIAAILGIIPASTAKRKGHSFWLWWFYGWMFFIIAIVHVQFIDDYNVPKTVNSPLYISSADEIKKYKELLDAGVITQDEFNTKKRQLLKM